MKQKISGLGVLLVAIGLSSPYAFGDKAQVLVDLSKSQDYAASDLKSAVEFFDAGRDISASLLTQKYCYPPSMDQARINACKYLRDKAAETKVDKISNDDQSKIQNALAAAKTPEDAEHVASVISEMEKKYGEIPILAKIKAKVATVTAPLEKARQDAKAKCSVYDQCAKEEAANATFKEYGASGFINPAGYYSPQSKGLLEFLNKCACYTQAGPNAANYNKIKVTAEGYAAANKKRIETEAQQKIDDQQRAAANAKRQKDLKQQAAAHEKQQNSPQCQMAQMRSKYCENLAQIKMRQGQIDQENQILKETGVVNKVILHDAAAAKIYHNKENSQIADQYSKLGGDITATKCSPQQLDKDVASVCGG